ncbi:MAG: PEPxxWA-CTERM sorting domain-containing protein [Duganella sp.]
MTFAMPTAASAIQLLVVASVMPLTINAAHAASFSVGAGATSSSAQTLSAGQAGTVAKTGTLAVGGSDVAIAIKGNGATVNNQGTIKQTGDGRVIRDNTGVSSLLIVNGAADHHTALLQAADADVIQVAKANASVTLNNYGALVSLNASAGGAQAVDFNAITTGANIVNNHAGGLIQASEADAVRPGVNGEVNNWGTIRSLSNQGSSSDGIDAQANSGIKIFNGATGVVQGARHGITGGQDSAAATFVIDLTNEAGGIVRGMNGSGINLDGLNNRQTANIVNHGLISGAGITGDGDGIDVDGLATIVNTGIIRSINAVSAPADGLAYSEGVSFGGGSITNGGTIEGLVAAGNRNAVGRGITLAGNDLSDGTRAGLYGNATITNQSGGLIRGQSDSAIVAVGAASGYTVTIVNRAGATIEGGGARNAAIKTGADNTVIVSGGTINGASSGKAIEMGSGNNRLTITGGTIAGSIDGGAGGVNVLTFDAGAGNGFAYAGAIANFQQVEVRSGNVVLSGVSTYSGATTLAGGTLTLAGASRLAAGSALVFDGGTLQLAGAGANGQTFASLSLLDNGTVLLGGSALTFNGLGAVVSGKTLSFTEAASGAYAFRLLGDYSTDAGFLALMGGVTINGQLATFSFNNGYTGVAAAVPEPASYAMLLAGLGLVGAIARRRRQAV